MLWFSVPQSLEKVYIVSSIVIKGKCFDFARRRRAENVDPTPSSSLNRGDFRALAGLILHTKPGEDGSID